MSEGIWKAIHLILKEVGYELEKTSTDGTDEWITFKKKAKEKKR